MEIKSVASNPPGMPAVAVNPVAPPQDARSIQDYLDERKNRSEETQLDKKDIERITEELNDFMQSINTDIKFVLHQKTGQLMVQVVDMERQKVLREAPPKEILDVLARIRDFVGALLDKKI